MAQGKVEEEEEVSGTGGYTWTVHSMEALSRRPKQQVILHPGCQQTGHKHTRGSYW